MGKERKGVRNDKSTEQQYEGEREMKRIVNGVYN